MNKSILFYYVLIIIFCILIGVVDAYCAPKRFKIHTFNNLPYVSYHEYDSCVENVVHIRDRYNNLKGKTIKKCKSIGYVENSQTRFKVSALINFILIIAFIGRFIYRKL